MTAVTPASTARSATRARGEHRRECAEVEDAHARVLARLHESAPPFGVGEGFPRPSGIRATAMAERDEMADDLADSVAAVE
ncbi:MAG TPA: hypothetical protein VGZ32_11310 [Actinocrinis sp.]|jgi:hypothetical protein|uniref:hypothetical protein n=1 Tax=Actinocrinis sp. TaxID=1920516 RepID=UPI002DDD9A2C|nr:hypothetical protein [Actinocrinis sp.]HEV3170923.1 hypothetical protein [Actinocrinis sp.]